MVVLCFDPRDGGQIAHPTLALDKACFSPESVMLIRFFTSDWRAAPMGIDELAKVMQVVTGIAALSIAYQVYLFNKRKDRESVRDRAWMAQQSLNALIIGSEDAQRASEFAVTGRIDHNTNDRDIGRAAYILFIQLNRINLIWGAWRSGVVERQVVDELVLPTLWLYRGSEVLMQFCLSRGYSKNFVDFVNDQLEKMKDRTDEPKGIKDLISEVRVSVEANKQA